MTARILASVAAVREYVRPLTISGGTVGFVPTMGALHAGHASLMDTARSECDLVVVSIFVNPLQFDRKDDLERYPRTLDADVGLCEARGVDAVFAPSAGEMYPRPPACAVHVSHLSNHLCGAHRPGHFDGVATVVLKLLQIVAPQRAYFGEKDAQQLAIIKRLVSDLNLPTAIVGVPTVRESDGLAMSSRNRHLSAAERGLALALFGMLANVREQVSRGARNPSDIEARARASVPPHQDVRVEYLQLVDPEDLQPVATVTGPVLAAGAIWVGATRLIDNIVVIP